MSILSSLRSSLRSWLGLEYHAVTLDHIQLTQANMDKELKDLVREEVRQQLRDTVVGAPSYHESELHKVFRRGEDSNALLFERSLRFAIGSRLSQDHDRAVLARVRELVEPETFVDQIVDRILRKQLEIRHSTGA